MTALSRLLAEDAAALVRLRPRAAEPQLLERAVAAMSGDGGGDRLGPDDLGAVQARVAEAARAGTLDRLARRDLREGCRAFLHGPQSPGREPDIADAVLDTVKEQQRRAAFNALIDAYLDGFDAQDEAVDRLGASLADLVPRWSWREGSPWPERARTFALFDPRRSPERIARAVLGSDFPVPTVLTSAALDTDVRRTGGLAAAAFRAACAEVARLSGPPAVPAQSRLIDWARLGDRALAYPAAWPDYADALFRPWTSLEPAEEHKQCIMHAALGYGKDPRLEPLRWRPESVAYQTVIRWLTRASVKQFLDIVDQSLAQPEARRMWAYRRAFWTSYLLGLDGSPTIDQAWVAFGDVGARIARAASRRANDPSLASFGTQVEKGTNQSALVLQIGDLTIVDWSHSGKYNVWGRGDRNAPKLFQHKYSYGELDSAPHRDSHVGAANYTWQKRLAEIIEGKRFFSEKPSWRPARG